MKKILLVIFTVLSFNVAFADSVKIRNNTDKVVSFTMDMPRRKKQGPFYLAPGKNGFVDAATYTGMSVYTIDGEKKSQCLIDADVQSNLIKFDTWEDPYSAVSDHILTINPCLNPSRCGGTSCQVKKIKSIGKTPRLHEGKMPLQPK